MQTKRRKLDWEQVGQRVIAASVGGILTAVSTTPLDVVKVRVQAEASSQQLQRRVSPLRVAKEIVRGEGARGLFRGVGAALALTVPTSALYFPLYEWTKARVSSSGDHWWSPLCAGMLSRTVVVTILSPIEYIRTHVQAFSAAHVDDAMLPMFRRIVAAGGWQNLWSGLAPTLLRDVPFSAVYWGMYETLRSEHSSFLSGAAAGSLACIMTNPLDVLKTRRQMSIDGGAGIPLKNAALDVFHKEGIAGFFSGSLPRIVKVAPACAIMISSYELLLGRAQ